MTLASRGMVAAVRLAPRVPETLVRAGATCAADLAWLRRGKGVRRLEANLRRVRPDLDGPTLRAMSRAGMRNYLRYYAEAFTLPARSFEQLDARVRVIGADALHEAIAAGRSVVLALAHQGNWDLAGAWATRAIAPVTTVAERLEPPEVFDAFLALREGIGLRILPLDSGAEVFRELVRVVRAGGGVVPLLADRDLTSGGIEVDLRGRRARGAAGPAARAAPTGAPLFATVLRHERLHGARRRAAGTPWGLVVNFIPVEVPADTPRGELVAVLTQAWVDLLGADIAAHPEHWHMLQRVFVEDLDPERVAGGAR
ncbi:phosphatidylinositol mannoside acyltransferase [Actinotalea sp. M2MS4P-6]|uniref:phosphatidylinositol mannoside acyltransferase n=1 Tax=Actinotalea sp. M2MS4P-6 TaxID=2983762 RepID=UPI0021E45B4F|nr:phosphatidylinositol mannoside acyltransferase [Actinotalea sp. M2MS4P-6]MCV2394522.1 phosphatidylinositol mannoside acyltransferase [Actinotalea sp. M2MS4P-6]